ncbi:MAG: carbohydrate ABC transporter permease [Clostridia bacterium]|nr:carbohydrate ABC transporter permease [Clostridia bacterium]
MKETKGEKIFYFVNTLFMILLTLGIIYPIVYVISASFSSREAILTGKVVLFPVDANLEAYKYVFADRQIWISYLNSFFYTIVGTATAMAVTILGAYPLSKSVLPGKKIITFAIVLTMWFGAGTIPMYLNYRDLGLLNTRAAIILGSACSAYNFILLRNFFTAIPRSLEEAADIDGAGQWTILSKIYLPLSLPSIATISLFYAVARWNSYFWEMIILSDDSLMPLQVVIKKLIVDLKGVAAKSDSVDLSMLKYSEETVVYASIVVSAVPMLVLYPFIQKYFVKGVMVGAVKE